MDWEREERGEDHDEAVLAEVVERFRADKTIFLNDRLGGLMYKRIKAKAEWVQENWYGKDDEDEEGDRKDRKDDETFFMEVIGKGENTQNEEQYGEKKCHPKCPRELFPWASERIKDGMREDVLKESEE
jgi:hypothetical protein